MCFNLWIWVHFEEIRREEDLPSGRVLFVIGLKKGRSLLFGINVLTIRHVNPTPRRSFTIKDRFRNFFRSLVVFVHGNSSLIKHAQNAMRIVLLVMTHFIVIFVMGLFTANKLEINVAITIRIENILIRLF